MSNTASQLRAVIVAFVVVPCESTTALLLLGLLCTTRFGAMLCSRFQSFSAESSSKLPREPNIPFK